jgi:type I restriction-modification system DNA methylase subunit
MQEPILRSQLQQPYRTASWQVILPQILPVVEFFAQPIDFPLTSERERAIATARRQIGVATVADENSTPKRIAIYEIDVAANVDLPRNRVSLRELIARCIDQVNAHAVVAFFVQSGRDEYRLTYAARESSIDLETLEIQTRETTPKRFTFLLGPAEPCRTAAQRLGELAAKKETITFRDIEGAFSVERLNREFFGKYKEYYQRFVDHLINDTNAPEKIFGVTVARDADEFDRACKPVRDFVKRLLGRIVFLHFLQRKRWLGCDASRKDWKDGDRDFMLHYFDKAEQAGDAAQFHSRWLTLLFFDALNNPERPRDLFEPTRTRIPYLNGGLFEEISVEARQIDFPRKFFRDLLEFFAQYNFTIDENDPEENEVGIDPEMLGHIFENLLEDNKDKGAYYTPKAIVQYMCQQALLQYLRAEVGEHAELDRLVIEKDPGDRTNARSWIRQHAEQIEKRIDEVRICDPAVGSGAFPVGMLNEMLQIKLALDLTLDPHEAKKALIEACLHGVDIDPGAIEIARLRFWLSLVVDAKTPEPLPNLDYKLYCADSLIERVRGEPVKVGTKTPDEPQVQTEIAKLVQAKHRLYDAHSKPEKRQARHDLYAALGSLAQIELTHLRNQANFSDQDFGRVVAAIEELARLIRELEATKKAKVAYRERALDAIQQWFEASDKPTFLWQLHFGEVFAEGGFDIIIANPPYRSVQKWSGDPIQGIWRREFTTFASRGDIYCFFYERGFELLRRDGKLSFISSNKFQRAGYGAALRQLLVAQNLHTLIDFCELPVFAAATDPMIIVASRSAATANQLIQALVVKKEEEISLLYEALKSRATLLKQSELGSANWILERAEGQQLLHKVRRKGMPLGQYVGGRFYRGIITGLNEAFVIDKRTRARLVERDPRSAELIKPWIRGKDIKRWRHDYADLYVLLVPFGFHKKLFDYPAVLQHLRRFEDQLKDRGQCKTSRDGSAEGQHHWLELDNNPSSDYIAAFDEPKIVFNETSKKLHAYLDDERNAINKTGFIILSPDALMILAVMNSRLMDWFYRSTFPSWGDPWKAGRIQFRGNLMRSIPIPQIDAADKAKLSELAEACQEAAKTGDDARLQTLEGEIDQIVYRVFDLTPDEIALIESSVLGRPS